MKQLIKITLSAFLLMLGVNLSAQNYIMIKGQVWDLTGENLVGAHAYNMSRHYGTFTDIDGIFFLVMVPGDSLRVSMVGYKPYKMKIPERLSAQSYKLDITLVGDTIILKTAEIRPYPATYAEFRREFMKLKVNEEEILKRVDMTKIDYGNKYTLPQGGISLPGPFSALYNTFSKEAKELKKMNVILAADRLREDFIAVVGRNNLEKEFGIKTDEQIDNLISKCGITSEFLRSTSDYEVLRYLIKCMRH